MAITLVVNNIPFDYPEQGEQQPWGEAATGWAKEVTTVLNSTFGPSDILETSASINDNQVNAVIPGFFFDPAQVRSFSVRGSIYRQIGVTVYTEEFLINGLNTSVGANPWNIQIEGFGDSGVTFSIDASGQMKYSSTNLGGSSGIIKFRGLGILQT